MGQDRTGPWDQGGVTETSKRLTGRIAPERIRLLEVPRPPEGVVERFSALGDCTGIVSDVLDELGLPNNVVGASILRPTLSGKLIVGPALTLRNVLARHDVVEAARAKVNKMAEFEAHNLAQPGDVLVIEGVADVSNMGGISAQTGKRQGEVGAVVMGGIRDVAHSRAVDYPIWASDITPATGKWRIEAAEINGVVQIGAVRVSAGDLVIADDSGVVFVPANVMREVLEEAERKAKAEIVRCRAVDDGVSVPAIANATYGQR
jgi:4-hydroxy-4-methyl-2-oxoglutarate aldolase